MSDVVPDAARPDHRDPFPHRCALKNVLVTEHGGAGVSGDPGAAGVDSGGDDHPVGEGEVFGGGPMAGVHHDSQLAQARGEVADRVLVVLLSRNAAGQLELPTQLGLFLEQRDAMPALRGRFREGQSGRTGTHHGDPLGRARGAQHKLRLTHGARIDQAGHGSAGERVIQARLVAGNARVDAVRPALPRLGDECGVRQEGPGHGHEVGVPACQDLLGEFGSVDAVDRGDRDAEILTQRTADPRESRAGHARGDRGDTCLVPADARVDDGRARRFDLPAQGKDLLELLGVRDEIQRGEPVHHQEIRTGALADAPHDLRGKAASGGR